MLNAINGWTKCANLGHLAHVSSDLENHATNVLFGTFHFCVAESLSVKILVVLSLLVETGKKKKWKRIWQSKIEWERDCGIK